MSDIYDADDLAYNSDDENNAYDDQDDDIVPADSVWSFNDASPPLTKDDRQKLQGFIEPNPLTAPPEDESDVGKRKKR